MAASGVDRCFALAIEAAAAATAVPGRKQLGKYCWLHAGTVEGKRLGLWPKSKRLFHSRSPVPRASLVTCRQSADSVMPFKGAIETGREPAGAQTFWLRGKWVTWLVGWLWLPPPPPKGFSPLNWVQFQLTARFWLFFRLEIHSALTALLLPSNKDLDQIKLHHKPHW